MEDFMLAEPFVGLDFAVRIPQTTPHWRAGTAGKYPGVVQDGRVLLCLPARIPAVMFCVFDFLPFPVFSLKLLALETATLSGSCALCVEGRIVFRDCPGGRPHAETLLPLASALLADEGLEFSQLTGIAFDQGPGAFTGLRVGAGLAQGLAVGLGLPVIAIGSLAAMAWAAFRAQGARQILCVLDARMGQVYQAAFLADERGVHRQSAVTVVSPGEVPVPVGDGWQVVGNGLSAYPELAARLGGIPQQPEVLPHAAAVAELAALALAQGQAGDAADALPVYVRDKVAQTTAERRAAGLAG
jgi:tRNA threonylcarbamoyladenosine biosynthesis protein TsaB